MLLVLDSIGHHTRYDLIENLTNTKIVTKKAYCTLPGGRYPEANYNRVVSDTLKAHPEVKVLGINASACDLTNISPGASEEYQKQQASLSSYNTVALARNALCSGHNNLKKVIIPERSPRFDNLGWLNKFANDELHKAKEELPTLMKDKVVIGRHKLNCPSTGIQISCYGAMGTRIGGKSVDNLHLRGNSGMIAFTRSMADIIAQA
jgi:hypothetical protein